MLLAANDYRSLHIAVLVESPAKAPGDLQIICLFESAPANELKASLAELDTKLGGLLSQIRDHDRFRGTLGETLLITPKPGAIGAKRLLLIGLGNRESFTPELEQFIGEVAYTESERLRASSPTFAPTILDGGKTGINTGVIARNFMEGFERGEQLAISMHPEGKIWKPVVHGLTFLAGTEHAVDTQRGLVAGCPIHMCAPQVQP